MRILSRVVADFSGFGVGAALGWYVAAGFVSVRGLGSALGSREADLVSVLGFDSVFGSRVGAGFVSVRGLDSAVRARVFADFVSVRGLASDGLLVVRSRDAVLVGAAEDLNVAAFVVAVTAGRPWLTEAN